MYPDVSQSVHSLFRFIKSSLNICSSSWPRLGHQPSGRKAVLTGSGQGLALSRAVDSSFSYVPRPILWNFLQGHWIMTLVKVFPVRITTSEFSTSPLVALHWIVLVPLFRKLTWVGLLTESPKWLSVSGRIIHLARRESLLLSDFEAQPISIFPRPLLMHQPGVSAPHSLGP